MAEIDQSDVKGYREPTFKAPSASTVERMAGIRARYDRCASMESELRQQAKADFRFAWIQGTQWDDNLARRRGLRPKYEFNKLGQAIKQVVNGNRQNTPSIKVRANKQSTVDLADIRQGLMRNIEAQSHADSVYDWGALYAITSGFGAWRVSARYSDDESFDQDLFIERIANPLTSVWFDSAAKEPDRSDAEFAFVESNVSWEEFRERWPNAAFDNWQSASAVATGPGWISEKQVRIAEYWYKTVETETIYQLSDGRVVKASEWDPLQEEASEGAGPDADDPQNALSTDPASLPAAPAGATQGAPNVSPQAAAGPAPNAPQIAGIPVPPQPPVTILKTRTVKAHKVKSEIISGRETLEGPFDWPGKYIPIIPCYGNLVNDDGKDEWFGMVRWSADAQRLYNYNRSNMVEVLASQSRAPYLYTPAMVLGFEDQWQNMAVANAPGLPFNPDPSVTGGRPQRDPPPQFPSAMLQAAQVDDEDIKATTGIYAANLGQPSNETSGRAIQARQHQGNIATFDYQDSIARAVEHTGRVIDDLIPYYYDTYRELPILGADGAEKYVEVNKPVWNPEKQVWEKVNDLSQGKYDITVTSGPSYATQRMETLDAMLQMAQSGGPSAMLFQYGALKNMDVPGMDEVTEAVRMMLVRQGLLQPDENDPPPPPQQPNPAEQAAAAKAQTDAQRNQALAQKAEADAGLSQARTARTQVETHLMASRAPAEVASAHAQLATDSAAAAIAQSDAAWKTSHKEQLYDHFNNPALTQIANAETLPYSG